MMIPKKKNFKRIKPGVLRDKAWLDQIRSQSLPCAVTGRYGTDTNPVVPAHMGTTGTGCKAPDNDVLPMLNSEHLASHSQRGLSGVQTYWCDKFMNDKQLLLDVLKAYANKVHEENKCSL